MGKREARTGRGGARWDTASDRPEWLQAIRSGASKWKACCRMVLAPTAQGALLMSGVLAPAMAQERVAVVLDAIQVSADGVTGKRGLSTGSEALPAAVTVIGQDEIARTNVKDFTDLLRRVPGVNAFTYGQGDIGSPIRMRGFSGNAHGGDVAIYVDGVPQNFPSASQGGSGMSDLSWLTPDMIERIEVIKGPFSALYGDQARSGAINITTRTGGASSLSATLGRYGYGKLNGVLVKEGTHGTLFAAGEVLTSEGFRDNSDMTRGNLFAKYTVPLSDGLLSLRGHYYKVSFDSPGYLTLADLRAGIVDPRDANPYAVPLFGDAERYGAVLNYAPRGEAGWNATAYVEHYEKNRTNGGTAPSTNFQSDDRNLFGGRLLHTSRFGDLALLSAGAEMRYDRGDAWNQRYTNGQASGLYTNAYRLELLTYAAFVQGQLKIAEPLKLVAGLRHDRFDYDIDNLKRPAASTTYEASVTTPRIGLVYTPVDALELYANYGEGFRSAGAPEISPQGPGVIPLGSAGGVASGDLRPPKVESYDVGFNARLGPAWRVGASLYTTKNSSEIRETFSGSGVFEPIGDTEREGYEVDFDFVPDPAWRLYGSYGYVRARVQNPVVAGRDLIAGLPDRVAGLGVEYTTPFADGMVRANANYQYLSAPPFYLAGNTPEYAPAWLRYDLRLSYQRGPSTWTLYAILQPKRFASEMTGTSVDPRPRVDGGATYTYTF